MSKLDRKKKRKVTLPVLSWDMGATGPANQHGLQVEDAVMYDPDTGRAVNPNGVKRARRVDMLEVWHRRGTISTAGFNAGEKLRDAFERTQRSPGWPDNDRVDSSPKPDHAVAIQIDRMSLFHTLNKRVAPEDREIIDTVIFRRCSPATLRQYKGRHYAEGLAHLNAALERLANAFS